MRSVHPQTLLRILILVGALAGTNCVVAQPVHLIDYTNTWRYHTNKTDPGYSPVDAWTAKNFDDSSWPQGAGVFGYESSVGAGGVGTIYPATFHTFITPPNGVGVGLPIFPGEPGSPLSPGPNVAGTGGPSHYFRIHFQWSGPT